MNCHKVPLNLGNDRKQIDITDYPDTFCGRLHIFLRNIQYAGAPSQPAGAKSPPKKLKANKYIA